MDVATHLLVPYAAALVVLGLARRKAPGDARKASVAAVFGISGAAPDLDGLLDPLSESIDALYFLQHRGLSHTLLGAPLFALALAGALALAARAWPRWFGLFRWRAAFVPAAILGSLTHLAFDMLTYSGVPLLWPFLFHRVSLQLYHWLVIWLFPVGVVVLGLHALGRLSRPRVAAAGALVVAALVVVAGLRVWSQPEDLPEGALVYPQSPHLEWTVLHPLENGTWEAFTWRMGERSDYAYFEASVPPVAEEAVERARATNAYRGFLMGAFGPVVVRADPVGQDAWNVTFLDAAQRYEATHFPRWTPTEPVEDWGFVSMHVSPETIRVTHRGW